MLAQCDILYFNSIYCLYSYSSYIHTIKYFTRKFKFFSTFQPRVLHKIMIQSFFDQTRAKNAWGCFNHLRGFPKVPSLSSLVGLNWCIWKFHVTSNFYLCPLSLSHKTYSSRSLLPPSNLSNSK